ncbi:MAG: glycosyltransferase family 4 protein [Planctomycetales bacterium]|nr:glycosyltransferase family 4 protein [Planctomycetales bacterium]
MFNGSLPRVAYVVKRYPRFSETFIVNEILAHEAAGLPLDIFSLRPSCDAHFQDRIARVRAHVHYLPFEKAKLDAFWTKCAELARRDPVFIEHLKDSLESNPHEVYQAMHLADAIRQRGITHLHAHFATSATSVARWAARFAGIRYSVTAHAKDIFHESIDQQELGQKLGEASHVITVSEFNVRYLEDRYTFAPGQLVRLYNGLDLEAFPYASPAERTPRIVAVGRLVEKKGFDVLVDACRILRERNVEFHCHIAGDGEQESLLRERIAAFGLADSVVLLGGRPQADIAHIVQQAAVMAAPCVVGEDGNRDGLPTVLLEAMALGTPCVSTDVTGIPEVIRDGETGLAVAQHDAAALADALQTLLTNAELRERLAQQARALIEADFDVVRNAAAQRHLFSHADLSVAITAGGAC